LFFGLFRFDWEGFGGWQLGEGLLGSDGLLRAGRFGWGRGDEAAAADGDQGLEGTVEGTAETSLIHDREPVTGISGVRGDGTGVAVGLDAEVLLRRRRFRGAAGRRQRVVQEAGSDGDVAALAPGCGDEVFDDGLLELIRGLEFAAEKLQEGDKVFLIFIGKDADPGSSDALIRG